MGVKSWLAHCHLQAEFLFFFFGKRRRQSSALVSSPGLWGSNELMNVKALCTSPTYTVKLWLQRLGPSWSNVAESWVGALFLWLCEVRSSLSAFVPAFLSSFAGFPPNPGPFCPQWSFRWQNSNSPSQPWASPGAYFFWFPFLRGTNTNKNKTQNALILRICSAHQRMKLMDSNLILLRVWDVFDVFVRPETHETQQRVST